MPQARISIPAATSGRLLVGVLVDGTTKYGRSILRGVTHYANLQRHWVLFKDLADLLHAQPQWPMFDGIIYGGVSVETVDRCHSMCPHVVSCSGSTSPDRSPVVALDSHATGMQAAKHLLDCRLRHFAFFGSNHGIIGEARLAGFRATLHEHGHDVFECPILAPSASEWMSHTHRPMLIDWLRALPKPIGILCYDDVVAHDLAEACMEADIGVPEAVAIVGVNNDDLMCESAWPPLTSIETDHNRMGYHAAKLLDRLLSGDEIPSDERLTLLPPLGVVKRQSTDLLHLEDANLLAAIRFIREHACNPCSVWDVLDAVPVNRRWLERQFLSKLGRTPHDEIRRVRIESAQRLLPQMDLSLAQIAARCGFDEIKGFYMAFRTVTGTTPAAYRRAGASEGMSQNVRKRSQTDKVRQAFVS
ncbi:MAG: helix-turn-helix-domain containing protein AraC type [Phycisphaerales bacterium]|nr:helix-turn-helix-domain containing protein AraC type [Phycisphaerales bacterium]